MVRSSLIVLLLAAMPAVAQTAATPSAPIDPQIELMADCIAGTGQHKVDACTKELQQPNQTNGALESEYQCRGDGFRELGEYTLAMADYAEALRRLPGDIFALDSRGKTYDLMGEYEKAIADFNTVLASPPAEYGLKPEEEKVLVSRGEAYAGEGQFDRAIEDYDQALRVKAKYIDAFIHRGYANFAQQRYDAAVADFSQAVSENDKSVAAQFGLGYSYYMQENYAEAATAFRKASDLSPAYAYSLLWLHLARMRLHQNDKADFAQRAAKISMTAWPAPVVKYFLGEMYEVGVITASIDSDPQKDAGQGCETKFYIGEDDLIHQRRGEARLNFNYAAKTCPKRFVEYGAALAELKRMGPARPMQ